MIEKLFVLWLAFLPLVIWKTGYEGPKIAYFLFGCIFVTIYWIFGLIKSSGAIKFSKADKFYFLWLSILTISSFLGKHPLESITGGSYRHQGVIFFLGLWLVGKTIQDLSVTGRNMLIKAVSIVLLAECLIVFSQVFGGNLYFGKALGTFGEANAVAGYLAMGIYFVSQTFSRIYLLLPLAVILLEQSRSGILAVLPFFTVYWKKALPVMGLIILGFVAIVSFQKTESIFENRNVIWKMGVNKIWERPVLGYGAESGEFVFDEAFKKAEMPLSGLIFDRAHNLILDVTLWSGVVGLLFFGAWLYSGFTNLEGRNKKLAVVSFIVFSMFQPLGVVHWVFLIIMLTF